MSQTTFRTFRALVILAATALAPFAFAQVTTTGIRGLVRDPSGAVIPNAALKLKDTSTGIEKSTVSTAEGAFAFANL